MSDKESKKNISNLSNFKNKKVNVKLLGGKEFFGILRSFDDNFNLVLENENEYIYCCCGSLVAICFE